jgi:hypothetical protein
MTRLSRRRRHNFRKNAVRDAENFRLTPMPQISGCKAHPAIAPAGSNRATRPVFLN